VSERTLDSDLKTGAESPTFNYVIFVELAFPSGTVRVHNSVGTLEFGGNDYLGVGAFGSIEAMEESIDLVDNPVKVTLSSITQEIIDAIQTDDIYNRDADIYLGALNADGELEGTPTNWISGYMEHASLLLGENNGVVIQIQTRAARLKQRNGKRFTLEDHDQDYSLKRKSNGVARKLNRAAVVAATAVKAAEGRNENDRPIQDERPDKQVER
jgi:hypothetical protein